MELTRDWDWQPLRECVEPPILIPFPEFTTAEALEEVVEFYGQELVDAGYFMEPCDHLSDREILHWIYSLLKEEVPVEPKERGNMLIDPETCPDCIKQALERMEDEPVKIAEIKLKRCRKRIREAEHTLETGDTALEGIIWPPGADRALTLINTLLNRLEEDISDGTIELLSGSYEYALNVAVGLEAVLWLVAGLQHYFKRDLFKAHDCISGGTRMARILAKKPPDDQPGRLYRDLGFLVPDAEFYTFLARDEYSEREETFPTPPDPDSRSARAWSNFFYTSVVNDEPFFRQIVSSRPSTDRLKELHSIWKYRQLNAHNENSRYEAISKQVLLQSSGYDPEMPHAFFERGVEYEEGRKQIIEEMPEDTAGLAVIISQMETPIASEPPLLNEEPSEENEAPDDPLHKKLLDLKESLLQEFSGGNYDDVNPLPVVLIYLTDLALEWAKNYDIYSGELDHDTPQKGAYLLTAECAEKSLDWLEIVESSSYQEEFEKLREMAREKL